MACPYLSNCSFQEHEFAFLHKVISINYCNGHFNNCARKIIRDSGGEVPAELMPNGEKIDLLKPRVK